MTLVCSRRSGLDFAACVRSFVWFDGGSIFKDTQEAFDAMKQLLAAFLLATFSAAGAGSEPGAARFHRTRRKTGAGGGQYQHHPDCPQQWAGWTALPFDENDPMYEFFRRFIPRQPGMPGFPGAPRDFESRSLGSGFVVSADGYILTNAHVVDSADEILVRLTDKREFKARVIGTDKRTDVALIKIEATGLPTVRLGDPGALKVGEWVVAIGSPFGFDNSVTAGIVSAKGRSLPQENYVPFIQTDVGGQSRQFGRATVQPQGRGGGHQLSDI
ncbi:MAG: trypsin-like peptidase domain-containing protein [Candidatus Accumulibacter propinquus]